MSVHQALTANIPAKHDFLSFTWAPKLMAAYRRLAARSKQPLKKYLEQAKPLNFHEMALEDIPFDDNARVLKDLNSLSHIKWGEKTIERYKRMAINDRSLPRDHNEILHPFVDLNKSFAGYGMTLDEYAAEIAKPHINKSGQIDISRLDDLCHAELTDFLSSVSRNLFSDAHTTDLATDEAWKEVFVAIKRPRGMLGYSASFDLWFNGFHIGVAASGASNGGCYISMSGAGCELLDFDKVFEVIRVLPAVKITRLDICVDFMEGEFSIDDFKQMYIDGEFTFGSVTPKWGIHSGGELRDRSLVPTLGETFTIGKRENGKMFRCYEKGRQLGDPDSKWVRGEVELRCKDREIPLYALQRPADYFAGAYPALEKCINDPRLTEVTRITTRKQKVEIAYSNLKDHAKTAYGALINVMRHSAEMTDKEIVDALIRNDSVPRSITIANGVTPYQRPEEHAEESVFNGVYEKMLDEVRTKYSILFRVLKNSKELSEVEIFNLVSNQDKGQSCLTQH